MIVSPPGHPLATSAAQQQPPGALRGTTAEGVQRDRTELTSGSDDSDSSDDVDSEDEDEDDENDTNNMHTHTNTNGFGIGSRGGVASGRMDLDYARGRLRHVVDSRVQLECQISGIRRFPNAMYASQPNICAAFE